MVYFMYSGLAKAWNIDSHEKPYRLYDRWSEAHGGLLHMPVVQDGTTKRADRMRAGLGHHHIGGGWYRDCPDVRNRLKAFQGKPDSIPDGEEITKVAAALMLGVTRETVQRRCKKHEIDKLYSSNLHVITRQTKGEKWQTTDTTTSR